MRAVQRIPFRPEPPQAPRATPIDRYLGRDDRTRRGHWTPGDGSLARLGISLIDTTGTTAGIPARDDAACIWHVLWVRHEADARISVGADTWPIAPGDSVIVPPGSSSGATGGQLAVAIAVPDAGAATTPPTHGTERFFGFNRRTVCCRVGEVRLCRWKLTRPLALAEHHPESVLVLALARDAVIRTGTTIDRLAQGELALVDPAAGPVVTPDGLAYLLTIDREPRQD
jgi:hypothetical protein